MTLIHASVALRAVGQQTTPGIDLPSDVELPEGFEIPQDIEDENFDNFNDPVTDFDEPPSQQPLPERTPPPQLPPPSELLRPSDGAPQEPAIPGDVPETIYVERFVVNGSTVFSEEELAAVTAPFEQRELSFAELLQARSAVTQLYVDNGYITSGAFIPPQTLEEGIVAIQVLEGRLEDINVEVEGRLRPGYVRRRLRLAGSDPLNVEQLLEGLQLLQLDPIIETISAELAAGVQPGTSILDVTVVQADTFDVDLELNNGRSPSVGSFRQEISIRERNLIGLGDNIGAAYSRTSGSDTFSFDYTIPVNARNGTIGASIGFTDSNVIEDEFEFLDIESDSQFYELTYRQPIIQTPSQELALSLTASRRESKSEFLEDVVGEAIPFPSRGSDEDGRTRVSALRFAQEFTRQGSRQVIAARSQFSFGLDAFDSTISDEPESSDVIRAPDSRFFAWRGQAQWVRLLARDTLLLVRGDIQLADNSLVPLEQFGLGGQQTVRGYRQDELLTDNGLLFSTEVRIPIARARRVDGLLQIAPFFDIGHGWNLNALDPDPDVLAGVGVGLLWRMGDRLSARFDYGIPLIDIDTDADSLQENGFYFSLRFTPF
ncbi:MAG: ShlB/FhaC/HecB family hemolysin secretion/activation protein [Leptolyngbyaceae bacterium]|nr:ShlB/FhaC/HecB family hemolysin secretion/activation protein [Leptolyngbyaceae bacterium]